MRFGLGGVVLGAALTLGGGSASAQGNYRAVPTGGRSALMGNTGVAMASDGAAPFLNPAAIVSVEDTRVALSVNFYAVNATSIPGFHAPRGSNAALGKESLVDARIDALPSTFCFFLTLGEIAPAPATSPPTTKRASIEGRRKLAFCAGTTERRQLSASATVTGDAPDGRHTLHSASIDRTYGRVHVGPTYGLALSDKLSLGLSLHVVDTNAVSLTAANASSYGAGGSDASASALASSANGTSFDVAGLLGATYAIDPGTVLGLAFGPPSLHIAGQIDASENVQQSGIPGGDYARARSASGDFSTPLPMRLGLGIGARRRRFRIEADATYFFPLAAAFRASTTEHAITTRGGKASDVTNDVLATTRAGGVIDSAIGAEVFLSDSISVLGGLAADFGATPRLLAEPALGTVVTAREDRVMATLGLGSYGDGTELLVGAQLALARGSTLAADNFATPSDLAPVPQNTTTVLFVIAGSTSLATIRRTLDDLRHTLPVK